MTNIPEDTKGGTAIPAVDHLFKVRGNETQ